MISQSKNFIKEYSLTRANLTVQKLEQIIRAHGFIIIRFDKYANSDKITSLLKTLDLTHMIETHKGFSYEDEDNGFVFIKSKLTEKEKKDVYLHELGHIQLRHTRTKGNEILQELQAEVFSACVKILLYINHIAKNAVMALLLVIITVTAIAVNNRIEHESGKPVETEIVQISPQIPDTNSTVYITASGKKYHKPDCRYVKNKTNIKEISKSEAIRLEYEPCKICNP